MDTYGDMVTLLLCFFVLLYSITSVDQQKWEILVKSLNPQAEQLSQVVTDQKSQAEGIEVTGGVRPEDVARDDFDELYYTLKEAVAQCGLSEEQVQLSKGDGYTFITFRDNVFFDGDSSVIRPEGRELLDRFADALGKANESIREMQILGHTSQGDPNHANNPEVDWVLSSERAARVTAYLQMHSTVEPDKMIAVGYGQFRPIAGFDTRENRAKNRRVEIIITKDDAVERSLDEYYSQVYGTEKE